MAAWYNFGVRGFYPVTPASGMYAIGAPQFPSLKLHFIAAGKQRQFTVEAKNGSTANKYIQKVTPDGTALTPFIRHQQIVNGQQMVFEMGSVPNYSWK